MCIRDRRREDDGLLFDRSLVLRAPAAELSAGIVDVGDGLAPVVLVLSRDANEVALVRLFRAGFREERYAVLGLSLIHI